MRIIWLYKYFLTCSFSDTFCMLFRIMNLWWEHSQSLFALTIQIWSCLLERHWLEMMLLINSQSVIRFDFYIQDCHKLFSCIFYRLFVQSLSYQKLFEWCFLFCLQKLADLSNSPDARLIDGILLTKFDTIDDKVDTLLQTARSFEISSVWLFHLVHYLHMVYNCSWCRLELHSQWFTSLGHRLCLLAVDSHIQTSKNSMSNQLSRPSLNENVC